MVKAAQAIAYSSEIINLPKCHLHFFFIFDRPEIQCRRTTQIFFLLSVDASNFYCRLFLALENITTR